MSKKKSHNTNGIVYSTDPEFKLASEETQPLTTLPASEQKLKLVLDKKQRAGKAVTLVEGFYGTAEDLETLGKTMKTFCGTGGSVKEGIIIIQGDQREKLMQWLLKNGYKHTKKSG